MQTELPGDEQGGAPQAPRGGARRAFGLGLVVAFAAMMIAAMVWATISWQPGITIDGFVELIRSWGMWGVALSIALMVLHSFVPVPAELLACANGMVYGAYWGTLITWVGAMLGASVAFALARRFGRPLVERLVHRRNWQELDQWTESHGWMPLLISRFVPVIAFNLINYAAGLTRVGWWQFIWTTGIGILPLTVAMVVFGDNFSSMGWQSWIALAAFALASWFVLRRVLRRRRQTGGAVT